MHDSYLTNPIQWSEGMLLSSQHFQQNHIYWESQNRHHLELYHPFFWGFKNLKINETRLLDGIVCIEQIHAVMPDGLVIYYDSKSGSPGLEIDLKKPAAQAINEQITVHLVVPVRINGSASTTCGLRRFESIEGEDVVDENTGENPIRVSRLQPILMLVAEAHPAQKYIALPLLKGTLNSGKFVVQAFYPPMLVADAVEFSSYKSLKKRLESIELLVRTCAMQVNEIIQRSGEREKWSLYEKLRLTLNCLISVLPQFTVAIRSGEPHPFELYKALANLLGNLSVIDNDTILQIVPPYDHNNITSCFEYCFNQIERICKSITVAYITVTIEADKNGVFTFDITQCFSDQTGYILLEITGSKDKSRKHLMNWVNSCRIGTEDAMENLKKLRHTGAARKIMISDNKMQIQAAPGNILLAVDKKSEYIKRGSKLMLQCIDSTLNENGPLLLYLHIPAKNNDKQG
jgi:type VI secretion system protein ImpJ